MIVFAWIMLSLFILFSDTLMGFCVLGLLEDCLEIKITNYHVIQNKHGWCKFGLICTLIILHICFLPTFLCLDFYNLGRC